MGERITRFEYVTKRVNPLDIIILVDNENLNIDHVNIL